MNKPLLMIKPLSAGHGILPLEVPLEASGSYVLQTLVNCTGNDHCELQSSSQMRLVGPVRDVIIRPAKHAYRPGETGKIWILIPSKTIMEKRLLCVIPKHSLILQEQFHLNWGIILEMKHRWKILKVFVPELFHKSVRCLNAITALNFFQELLEINLFFITAEL